MGFHPSSPSSPYIDRLSKGQYYLAVVSRRGMGWMGGLRMRPGEKQAQGNNHLKQQVAEQGQGPWLESFSRVPTS